MPGATTAGAGVPVPAVLLSAEAEGRSVLLEHEVYALLASAGIGVPRHPLVPSPFKVGNMDVRNRIVMLPLTTGYTEADETIGDRFINFFTERAKGGVGLIIIPFAPVPGGSPVEPGLFDDRFISGARD